MRIKSINELHRIESELLASIQENVRELLQAGWFVLGRHVQEFEEQFASYTGVSSCIGVANGTDSLEIALRALGISGTSRVATVANAGFYSSNAILACGASPCYIDVEIDTGTMSVDQLAQTFRDQKIDAVIITHLYGRLANIGEIQHLCERHQVPLIEDCAQGHGASRGNRRAGSFGKLACFSFYPTKNLGAMGDGGAICTNDEALATRIRSMRQYGWHPKYHVVEEGGRNSRLDEIQACILKLKLPYLDGWNRKRRHIAQRLNEGIVNTKITRKPLVDGEAYVAHLYVLQVDDRPSLIEHLKAQSIPHDTHYPIPDYRQPVLLKTHRHLGSMQLHNTEKLSHSVLTLPCFPSMTDLEIDTIVAAINGWK
jgi:dTDP-4-amino-4,6-dideoxygalactose transaminase